jgi:Uma2 family endonuclease
MPGEEETEMSAPAITFDDGWPTTLDGGSITFDDGQRGYIAPRGGLTAADLSDFPDDGLRRELHDGVVYVTPLPSDRHQWADGVFRDALKRNVPEGLYVMSACGVHMGIGHVCAPDVLVVRSETSYHHNGYDPGGVVLAVEIVSPSSETMDKVTKPALYARNGIANYWRLARKPDVTLYCYVLDPETRSYQEIAVGKRGDTVRLTEPWPIEVVVEDLVIPHHR